MMMATDLYLQGYSMDRKDLSRRAILVSVLALASGTALARGGGRGGGRSGGWRGGRGRSGGGGFGGLAFILGIGCAFWLWVKITDRKSKTQASKYPTPSQLQRQEILPTQPPGPNVQTESCVQTEHPRLCPECGSPMLLRTASKGRHVGKKFMGCSKFPRCRGIRTVQ
ncbi:topoisomerase DNA-binding C4 zinc finger domain-containing protein [Pseudomonas cremoricolorata]|uniref:topoisomerase DNA-binding C4 zinc finger domain-containing protein n=1 Tax=Pseudomonas cremoricolorata TaxID=157783 RepID=UPI0009DCB7A9